MCQLTRWGGVLSQCTMYMYIKSSYNFVTCISIKLKGKKHINIDVKSGKKSVNGMTKSPTIVENNLYGKLQYRSAGEGSYCLALGEER